MAEASLHQSEHSTLPSDESSERDRAIQELLRMTASYVDVTSPDELLADPSNMNVSRPVSPLLLSNEDLM